MNRSSIQRVGDRSLSNVLVTAAYTGIGETGMSTPTRRAAPAQTDAIHDRIAAYRFPRGLVDVVRINRGYTLSSRRTGRPVARLRLTGNGDRVRVYWWRRE